MDLIQKYQKDLSEKIKYLEEQILEGSSYEDSEGITIEYTRRVERLKGLKEAEEIFKNAVKVFAG
jgi:hypothetical protein